MSRFLAPLASVVFAFLAWPVHALAKAAVRFVHAVPGAGAAVLTIDDTSIGTAEYGKRTTVKTVRPGQMKWTLSAGGDTLASGTGELADASYTAVAIPRGSRLTVELYRNAASTPRGKARVRVIHASPEFGTPDLVVDGKRVVRKLSFGKATPYLTLAPGEHDLAAVRAGTDEALLEAKGVRFRGDSTTSAIVIGTRGEPSSVITVTDRVARRESGASTSTTRASKSEAKSGSRTVARGDSLWSIAKANLGAGASDAEVAHEVKRIWDRNADSIGTGDPNLIFPGQTLSL